MYVSEQKWVHAGIPLGILLLNILYKILFLGSRDISIDEPFTLFYSQMPWQEIFHMLAGENNPPLHFLLMHVWINLVGIDPFKVRLLSLIFGALSSMLIYFIGTRNFSRTVGISAALLFTFSNFNTFLAQEARVYSLFIFLTLASVYLFLNLVKEFKTKTFVYLIVINILLIYSHFFAFWLLVVEYLFVFLNPHTRKQLYKPFLLMGVLLFVAFLPYLVIFINRVLASSGGTWLEPPTISSLYNLLWKFCNQPVPTVMVILLLSLGLGKYIFSFTKRKSAADKPTLFLILWFLLPTIVTYFISFLLPVFYEKYLVFIAPAIYLLVCKSVEYLSNKHIIRYGLLLLLISGFIITSTPQPYCTKSISSLSNDINALRDNQNPVVITPGYFDKTFIYHYNRLWFKNYQFFGETLKNNYIIPVYDTTTNIGNDLIDCKKVFLIEAGSQYLDPSAIILQKLKQQFDSIEMIEYDDVLKLYILRKVDL